MQRGVPRGAPSLPPPSNPLARKAHEPRGEIGQRRVTDGRMYPSMDRSLDLPRIRVHVCLFMWLHAELIHKSLPPLCTRSCPSLPSRLREGGWGEMTKGASGDRHGALTVRAPCAQSVSLFMKSQKNNVGVRAE